jgi:hypothetical protein
MRLSKDKSIKKANNIDSYDVTGGGAIDPFTLLYFSGAKVVEALAESALVCGANQYGTFADTNKMKAYFGKVKVKTGAAVSIGDKLKCVGGGLVAPIIVTQAAIGTGTAGNFGNQPAGSKVTVVSDNNVADKIPTITIYGTKTGATTVVASEVIQLNGTTAVDSVAATWQTILGWELSAACTGTVTVKNGAGDAIESIAGGVLSKGVVNVAAGSQNAYGSVVRIVAGGASTKVVGVIGVGVDGLPLTACAALNGATEKDIAASRFGAVTKILIGDVATGTVATVNTAAAETSVAKVGRALSAAALGALAECYIAPY